MHANTMNIPDIARRLITVVQNRKNTIEINIFHKRNYLETKTVLLTAFKLILKSTLSKRVNSQKMRQTI